MDVLTIVGVGLIGGSIGLAVKRRGLARRVRGLGRTPATLDKARSLGAIDEIHLEPAAALRDAELVVFCTPVDQIADQAVRFASLCPPQTIFTDAGSTKALIVERLERDLPAPGPLFVGSHPLAGSEKRGPEFADPDLFQGRCTVVTPTARTAPTALATVQQFWERLGSWVRLMPPREHDRALAVTSHVPHLVAAALATTLPPAWRELTATGFRDTTRIAAGDPGLWTAIFRHNRAAVLAGLEAVAAQLTDFRRALEADDGAALTRLLTQAKEVRDALGS
ncbi:MAG: prephenate dehydrogenase/arogenate dehydrogenase family protein [Gemmataceae bacterium]|nr:prephenate dehydrogenase/arogenate dehydrogenase family protein [Gemmataceae bacterium]